MAWRIIAAVWESRGSPAMQKLYLCSMLLDKPIVVCYIPAIFAWICIGTARRRHDTLGRRYHQCHGPSLSGIAVGAGVRRSRAELAFLSRTRDFRRRRPPESAREMGRRARNPDPMDHSPAGPGAFES